MTDPAQTDTTTTILNDAKQGVALIAGIMETLSPQAALAGFTIDELSNLAEGLIDGVPAIVAAWNSVKAAHAGGAAPTNDQITALKAAIDADDDALEEEVQQLDKVDEAAKTG